MNRVDAFRFLIRCLAPEDRGANLAKEIAAGAVCWERVVEIASAYWMTLVLYRELDRKGLLDCLPSNDRNDLLEYFQTIHKANAKRNLAILEHAGQLVRMFNAIGVQPLLLKGAAHLASGLYADPAVRFMDDIDLLVPGEQALECWRLLIAAGYQTTAAQHRDKRVECMPDDWPSLRREGRRGEVEIHRRSEWPHLLNSPSLYLEMQPLALDGGKAWTLNPTSRLIFTLAHAYVHDRLGVWPDAPFRDLYDATLLARSFAGEIDWQRVMETFERGGHAETLRIAVMMWQRLFSEGPPCAIGHPRWGWIYWRRCLLQMRNSQWRWMESRVVRNIRFLRIAVSRTPEGASRRRELRTPAVLRRKLRTIVKLYERGRPRGIHGDNHGA